MNFEIDSISLYFDKNKSTKGIMDIKDKYFFKALLAYDILYYKQIENRNWPSPLIFFSYYFMYKEKPIIPILKTLRQLDMKVHVSPGEKLFASLTNHVISLKLKTRCTIWEYNEIFRMLDLIKGDLSSYEIFDVFCFIIQNYLFTFNFWESFIFKLQYFKDLLSKDYFYITYLPNIIFFFMYLILFKIFFFNLYYSLFILSYNSFYWLDLII